MRRRLAKKIVDKNNAAFGLDPNHFENMNDSDIDRYMNAVRRLYSDQYMNAVRRLYRYWNNKLA